MRIEWMLGITNWMHGKSAMGQFSKIGMTNIKYIDDQVCSYETTIYKKITNVKESVL